MTKGNPATELDQIAAELDRLAAARARFAGLMETTEDPDERFCIAVELVAIAQARADLRDRLATVSARASRLAPTFLRIVDATIKPAFMKSAG
jgi:hypothetical protein